MSNLYSMKHKDEILRLSAEGFSYNEISKALSCSKGTVSYHLGEGQIEKTNSRRKRHKKEIAEYLQDLKGKTPCADCGSTYPYWIMDFDHVRGKKRFNISQYSNKVVSLEIVKEEIAKCEIVCSNCHRHRTHVRYLDNLEDVPFVGGKDLRRA
jgi:DNA-binding CsgD family transcriptional regulator